MNRGSSALGELSTVEELTTALGSDDESVREQARERLVRFGAQATGPLATALESGGDQLRWEAAKVLAEIHDPRSSRTLVNALEDENAEVRWIAAEALSGLGPGAAIPVLHRLITNSESSWLREGAHHVFMRLSARPDIATALRPVIDRLDGVEPNIGVMTASAAALRRLEQAGYR